MNKLVAMAAIAALASTASPALAQGKGNAYGKGKHSQMGGYGSMDAVRDAQQRRAGEWRNRGSDDGRVRDNRGYRNASRTCPPGLAKKGNGCMPPGQAKKMWNTGQTLPRAYWDNYVPQAYRTQYGDDYRYYNGYLYRVDPQTHVIQEVIRRILN